MGSTAKPLPIAAMIRELVDPGEGDYLFAEWDEAESIGFTGATSCRPYWRIKQHGMNSETPLEGNKDGRIHIPRDQADRHKPGTVIGIRRNVEGRID